MKRPIINDTHKNDESFEGGLFDESPSKTKSEKIHKIANFIRHLESRIWDLTPQDLDSLLNVIIVSVSKKFTGRGIARHLLQCGLDDQAKELGYQGVFTEATALISQRIFIHLGIARHLLQCGLDDQAKELGYQGVFTEATALISQRLFKRLGYKDLYVLEHSQWLDENGEQIFRCADGTDRGVLAFKQL
uniref:N-acetyltransferase domain-containing protein n=1 Tax=Acrobeloides nanus TaxID=290746 RepID=A0A914CNK0_9BILA